MKFSDRDNKSIISVNIFKKDGVVKSTVRKLIEPVCIFSVFVDNAWRFFRQCIGFKGGVENLSNKGGKDENPAARRVIMK